MKTIINYRPGVVSNQSAFESMALIYKNIKKRYGYNFIIVKSHTDDYEDDDFDIISIPGSCWKYIQDTSVGLKIYELKKKLYPIFKKADILLTVDPTVYSQGLFAIKAAAHFKIPVWFDTSMTFVGSGPSFLWKLNRPFFRKALYQTTGIIATVPKCMERFQDLKLYDEKIAKKFTIMGHPVDTQVFRPLRKKSADDAILRILVISRLVPEKGIYYILEAADPILRQRADVILEIVGEGPMKPFLLKELKERGLDEKVKFYEKISHDEIAAILGSADIFINHAVPTNRWEEYFGAVNLEAMSCELPCILSKTGGIPFAVRENGVSVMVEPRDIPGIRNALNMLISEPESRKQIGLKAREYVKRHYDLSKISEKYNRMISF
jgi:glycosyltransferase involved in cell wall biosynthesis